MPEHKTIPHQDDRPPQTIDTLRVAVREGVDAGSSAKVEGATLTVGTAQGNDLVLTDPTVSRFHVELRRDVEGVWVTDTSSTNGTFVSGLRVEKALAPWGSRVRVGRTTLELEPGVPQSIELHRDDRLLDMVGRSDVMRRLMSQITRASRTETSVLIIGESGTGKELIARALHDLGPRQHRPFVTVDCGALATNLVASELFGHERGAFTGAERTHTGAFEQAHGGTLFLDEIGELPAELQPALLGALERRRFRRVGGSKDIEVDVRVVAATNRDLRGEVNEGRFRLDLYYRLAVVPLRVPSLRERPEDIELLVAHFVRELGYQEQLSELFSPEFLSELKAHPWQGNVRELRNLVEATVAMGEPMNEMLVGQPGVSGDMNSLPIGALLALPYKDARAAIVHEFEKKYLGHWLERSEGNVAKAARDARMDRSHFFHLLRRHDLRN